MCLHFDESALGQCLEEDAEDVVEKERVNFCEWFSPDASAYDPSRRDRHQKARTELEALFADGGEPAGDGDAMTEAEKLFK